MDKMMDENMWENLGYCVKGVEFYPSAAAFGAAEAGAWACVEIYEGYADGLIKTEAGEKRKVCVEAWEVAAAAGRFAAAHKRAAREDEYEVVVQEAMWGEQRAK